MFTSTSLLSAINISRWQVSPMWVALVVGLVGWFHRLVGGGGFGRGWELRFVKVDVESRGGWVKEGGGEM